MPKITVIEAAIQSGFSVELVSKLTKNPPKYKESRTLIYSIQNSHVYIDQADLTSFCNYLNEHWEKPLASKRPTIPNYIKTDVRFECHLQCAICGYAAKCEIAHIEPVSGVKAINGPDNLILLCPNHHTQFDAENYDPANVTTEEMMNAKRYKRDARRRVLRFEYDATMALLATLHALKQISDRAKTMVTADRGVAAVEAEHLMGEVFSLAGKVRATSTRNKESNIEKSIIQYAAELSGPDIRSASAHPLDEQVLPEVVFDRVAIALTEASTVLDIGEVPCPRCDGRGELLGGQGCQYCKGRRAITQEKADAYDPNLIDEVPCPHCNGQGELLGGQGCQYCKGRRAITQEEADAYARAKRSQSQN